MNYVSTAATAFILGLVIGLLFRNLIVAEIKSVGVMISRTIHERLTGIETAIKAKL